MTLQQEYREKYNEGLKLEKPKAKLRVGWREN